MKRHGFAVAIAGLFGWLILMESLDWIPVPSPMREVVVVISLLISAFLAFHAICQGIDYFKEKEWFSKVREQPRRAVAVGIVAIIVLVVLGYKISREEETQPVASRNIPEATEAPPTSVTPPQPTQPAEPPTPAPHATPQPAQPTNPQDDPLVAMTRAQLDAHYRISLGLNWFEKCPNGGPWRCFEILNAGAADFTLFGLAARVSGREYTLVGNLILDGSEAPMVVPPNNGRSYFAPDTCDNDFAEFARYCANSGMPEPRVDLRLYILDGRGLKYVADAFITPYMIPTVNEVRRVDWELGH